MPALPPHLGPAPAVDRPLGPPPAAARPPRPRPSRLRLPGGRRLAATAAVVALALVPSCASDGPDGPTAQVTHPKATTTRPPDPTTTTTPLTPEQKVEQAFLHADAVLSEIEKHPDPDDPRLAKVLAGPSLDLAHQSLREYRTNGIRVEYPDGQPPIPHIERVQLDGERRATVTFCLVDDARQVRTKGTEVVDDDVVSQRNRAELRFVRGAWLVFSQRGLADWPDGNGCDR